MKRIAFAAVVVAAGQGKRLGALGERYSKPMVPVLGRPLIEWIFDRLIAAGAEQLVAVVHPNNSSLIAHLENCRPGIRMMFQPQRLGVADAVLRGMAAIDRNAGYLACACDSVFPETDIAELVAGGRRQPATAAIGVLDLGLEATRSRSGVRLQRGQVIEVVEKPQHPFSPLVGLPIYWLPPEIERYLADAPAIGNERHVTTALADYIRDGGRVVGHTFSDRLELTSPEDLAPLEARLRRYLD